MAVKTQLPRRLRTVLDSAADELRSFIEEQRSEADAMSERWQESERAGEVSTWLDDLETVADALQDLRGSIND